MTFINKKPPVFIKVNKKQFNTIISILKVNEMIEIKETSVIINDELGKIHEIENDFVLAMTGYLPDFEFLKNSGIDLNGESLVPAYNPETMETNVENLYLAGVVCGGKDTHLWFIENSRIHAEIIIKHISEKI